MGQQVTLLSDHSVGQILLGTRDTFSGSIERARLQSIINFSKESALARQIISKDVRLQQATEESIKNTFMNVAFVGLSLNPIKQHATILALWNDKISRYEASLSIMYRGLMWLAGQAGVKDISIDVVYSADQYEAIRSSEGDRWKHVIARLPHDGIANKFELVYVGARMPGSTIMKLEQIPAEDIYRARDKSDSYLDKQGKPRESSPWVAWFDEMAKKTGLKRAQKRWEEAVIDNAEWQRFQTAVALDNANEGVIPARADDIPGTAEHVSSGKDKDPPPPAELLNMAQLTEIEKLVEQIAPNSETYPNNVSAYMAKLARTYRENSLSKVPASKFQEIKDRLNGNIEKVKNKKAADAKGESTKGQPSGGKQQDPAAKGADKKEGGKPQHASGGGSGDGKPTGSGSPAGERDPNDAFGPDTSGDPGPTS